MNAKTDTTTLTRTLIDVPVNLIDYDVPNHRFDGGDVKELSLSIERDGLRQPIEVWKKKRGKRFTLAFGHRRLRACKLFGLKTIAAYVVHQEHYNKRAIRHAQAVENLQREDLSPIEQADAIGALVDEKVDAAALTDATIEQAVEAVAGETGIGKRFVEDRLRLARLGAFVRKLINDGELLIGHALLIARVGDPKEQERLADHSRVRNGSPGQTLGQLRRHITGGLHSLRGTPWELDQAFAGKPACTDCEHNAGNQSGLFAGTKDDAAPEQRCLKHSCWKVKEKAAHNERDRVVKLLVKGKAATSSEAQKHAKPFIKLAPIVRIAKQQLGIKPTATAKTTQPTETAKRTHKPTETAHQKLHYAERKWAEGADDTIASWIRADPIRFVMYLIVCDQQWFRMWKATPKEVELAVKNWLEAIDKGDFANLATHVLAMKEPPACEVPNVFRKVIARHAGIDLPRKPILADFNPTPAEKPKPKARKTASKKRPTKKRTAPTPAKKKATRKKAARKPARKTAQKKSTTRQVSASKK